MSTELLPMGMKCNMKCPYCYEDPMRDAGNFSPGYDMEAMKAGLERINTRFSLFGGEPLLMPLPDMEAILKFGLEKWGGNGIQTNGTMITDEHVRLFRKYKVGVGISVDGPDELNDARWMGSVEATRAATKASMAAIRMLARAGSPPSLIVTIHRLNASASKLPQLMDWVQEMEDVGVRHIGIHLLESESAEVRQQLGLTENENVAALITMYEYQKFGTKLKFDLFNDMSKLLLGNDDKGTMCIWNACDPYTTKAVRGVDGLGNDSNCGRTNKDGVSWGKADEAGFERQMALRVTPFEDGGCKDCKYFFACKGQCPGTAIDGDWRNRTEHCQVWYRMFDYIERDLVRNELKPITIDGTSVRVEAAMARGWEQGVNLNVAQAIKVANGSPMPKASHGDHGDHWDAPDGYEHHDGPLDIHGDNGTTIMHGDSPHVDSGAR